MHNANIMQQNIVTYYVIWSEEDQEYVGLCREFPSLSFLAKSYSEAESGIISLIESLKTDKQIIDVFIITHETIV
jgi:predicted RNase H-like HicB family nuclease